MKGGVHPKEGAMFARRPLAAARSRLAGALNLWPRGDDARNALPTSAASSEGLEFFVLVRDVAAQLLVRG